MRVRYFRFVQRLLLTSNHVLVVAGFNARLWFAVCRAHGPQRTVPDDLLYPLFCLLVVLLLPALAAVRHTLQSGKLAPYMRAQVFHA